MHLTRNYEVAINFSLEVFFKTFSFSIFSIVENIKVEEIKVKKIKVVPDKKKEPFGNSVHRLGPNFAEEAFESSIVWPVFSDWRFLWDKARISQLD